MRKLKNMLDKDTYWKIKWLVAKNEFANNTKRGGFDYQKPKDDSIIEIHSRASGIQYGARAPQQPDIVEWLKNIDLNLFETNQMNFNFDTNLLPDIGVYWKEYKAYPLSTTVHTALEFMNLHKGRRPVIFENDFWYFQEIIDTKLKSVSELKENDLLIVSVPFFETFKYKHNMDDILKRCCDLDIPVMLDLIWLPLATVERPLRYTDCVQIIAQSMTKALPLSGIKGGVCFWRQPVPKRFNMYPLGNNVGFAITKKYLEHFGYYHVRDSLRNLQNKWCKMLSLQPHTMVMCGHIPDGHFLVGESLHSHRIAKSDLFNLLPFYENDKEISRFLSDIDKLDN